MSEPHSSNSRKRRAEDDVEGGAAKRGLDPNTVQLRLLCPAQKIGSIIGKGGEIVSRIRQETGARVKVEDAIPGCQERVILLSSPPWESDQQLVPAQSAALAIIERLHFDDKNQESSQKLRVRLLIDRSQTGPVLGRGGSIITKMRQESGAFIKVLDKGQLPSCAAANDDLIEINGEYDDCRQAVLLVTHRLKESPSKASGNAFNRGPAPPPMGQGHPPMYDPGMGPPMGMAPGMGYGIDNPSLSTDGFTGDIETVFRLLCPDANIGCVIGRGGEVVKRIRAETGARLKVADLVEGAAERVVHCSSSEDVHSPVVAAIDALLRCMHCLLTDQQKEQKEPVKHVVRMLVPANQIGAVLGKGGNTIKQIRSDTGAHLVVLPREKTPVCGERGDEVLTVEGAPPAIMDAMSMVASLLRNNMIRTQGVQVMQGQWGASGEMPGPPPPVGAVYHSSGSYPPAPYGSVPNSAVPYTLVSAQPGMGAVQLAPVDLSGHTGYQLVSVQGGHPTTYQVVGPRTVQAMGSQPPHVHMQGPMGAVPAPQPHYTYVQTPHTWQPGADPALTATAQVSSNVHSVQVPQTWQQATDPSLTATAQVGTPMGNQPHAAMSGAAGGQQVGGPSAMATSQYQQQAAYTVPVTNISVKLLIQQAQVGPLLGRNGSNISHVRQTSGARMKLHESSLPNGERELEITGTYEQTQEAQRMVTEILTAAAQGVKMETYN